MFVYLNIAKFTPKVKSNQIHAKTEISREFIREISKIHAKIVIKTKNHLFEMIF